MSQQDAKGWSQALATACVLKCAHTSAPCSSFTALCAQEEITLPLSIAVLLLQCTHHVGVSHDAQHMLPQLMCTAMPICVCLLGLSMMARHMQLSDQPKLEKVLLQQQ